MIAWQFPAATKTPAAQVNAMPLGADWPEAPFVFQAQGEAAVYVLDSAPGQALPSMPSGDDRSGSAGNGASSSSATDPSGPPTNPTEVDVGGAPA